MKVAVMICIYLPCSIKYFIAGNTRRWCYV